MLPGIGLSEIIVVFVVLLLVVGSHKLPEIARNIGRMISRLKQASYEFKRALYLDEIRDEVYQPVKDWNPTQEVKQFVDHVAQETFSSDPASPPHSHLSGSEPSLSSVSSLAEDGSDDAHLNDDQHEDHFGYDHVDPGEYHSTPFSTVISQPQNSQNSQSQQADEFSTGQQSQNGHDHKEIDDEIDDEMDDVEESIPSQDPLMANIKHDPSINEDQTNQGVQNTDVNHKADSTGASV